MKLKVNNNWENYQWSFGGSFINVKNVDTVIIEGYDYDARAAKIYNTVYDHGHSYVNETYDLEIKTEVAGAEVWVSLYKNRELLDKVTGVEMRLP